MNKYDSVYNLPKGGYYNSQPSSKHTTVSWGAIVAGIVTSFMVAMVLTMLLMGLGLSSFDMQADNPGSTAGLSLGIGSVVIMIISLFAGSYMAGRLSGRAGATHGFLNWATLSLLAFALSAMAISSAVKLSSSLVGSAFNMGAAGVAQNQDSIKSMYNDVKENGIVGNVKQALTNSALSNDFLKQHKEGIQSKLGGKEYANSILDSYRDDLNSASNVISKAAQDFKNNPNNAQSIADKLKSDLDGVAGRLGSPVEGTNIYNKLLADNIDANKAKSMSEEAVNEINIARVETRNKIMDSKTAIAKTQDNLNNLPQMASDMLGDTANKVGHGAWWALLSSIIGAAISAFAGSLGAKGMNKKHEDHYELHPMHADNHTYRENQPNLGSKDFVSDVKIRNKGWNDNNKL